jgi:hypothetical protein
MEIVTINCPWSRSGRDKYPTMIVTKRQIDKKVEVKIRYLIASEAAPIKNILKAKRRHRTIEVRLHCVSDIAFRKEPDECAIIMNCRFLPPSAILHYTCSNKRELSKPNAY